MTHKLNTEIIVVIVFTWALDKNKNKQKNSQKTMTSMTQFFKNKKFHRKKISKIFFSLRNLQIHSLISFYLTIFGIKLDFNFSAV